MVRARVQGQEPTPSPARGHILEGAATGLGIWLFLWALGLAIGFSLLATAPRGAGTLLTLWSILTPVLVCFVGAWVAARSAKDLGRAECIRQSLGIWGLLSLVSTVAFVTVVALLFRGLMTPSGPVPPVPVPVLVKGYTYAVSEEQLGKILALNSTDILAETNPQLVQKGAPPLSPRALESALARINKNHWVDPGLEVGEVAAALTSQQPLSKELADGLAARLVERWYKIRPFFMVPVPGAGAPLGAGDGTATGTTSETTVPPGLWTPPYLPLRAAVWFNEFSGRIAAYSWAFVFSLLLALGAALLGGAIGAPRSRYTPSTRSPSRDTSIREIIVTLAPPPEQREPPAEQHH